VIPGTSKNTALDEPTKNNFADLIKGSEQAHWKLLVTFSVFYQISEISLGY